jgi:hypothetical protein
LAEDPQFIGLLNVMSAQVRLPLVEPSNDTKAEIASVLAEVCDQYSDHMIGNLSTAEPIELQANRAAAN